MLKPTVKRGLMLDFIPDEILCIAEVNKNRIYKLNKQEIKSGEIIYFMQRELRIEDNWALLYAQKLARKYKQKFKLIINLNFKLYSNRQLEFIKNELDVLKTNLSKNKIEYCFSSKIPTNAGAIVFDFNPIDLHDGYAKNLNYAAFEVDSHNIIPARFISKKQEFSAATLRKKIYASIADFLTEFPQIFNVVEGNSTRQLNKFIKDNLNDYSTFKNDPNKNVTSHLSTYLHFGLISAQRIALEIIKSKAKRDNKEAFLEELIVRKELSDNFCLYNKNFRSFDGAPTWAQESLNAHRNDLRIYTYNLLEFENAQTHDELWNKIQNNLVKTGKIHGYLRMYWAKKILEWSRIPENAIKIAVYLNDTYALDGNEPNGYVGILWSICGLHDRAFTNRMVTGKIRYMSLGGCNKKFDLAKYIASQEEGS